MSPAAIDTLKKEWTGKRVAVVDASGRLRRFQGQVGTVVTVNMNGRALVQFEGDVDIGWYDISPANLRVVVAPEPQSASAANNVDRREPQAASLLSASSPAASEPKPSPRSILELARRQGAAKPKS